MDSIGNGQQTGKATFEHLLARLRWDSCASRLHFCCFELDKPTKAKGKTMKTQLIQTNIQSSLSTGYRRGVGFIRTKSQFVIRTILSLLAMSGLYPSFAWADLPSDNTDMLPDAINGTDAITQSAQATEILFKWGAAVIGVAIMLGTAYAMYKSFSDRKQGDNREFGGTVAAGVFMIVIGLAIVVVGFEYASGMAAQVTALGGAA